MLHGNVQRLVQRNVYYTTVFKDHLNQVIPSPVLRYQTNIDIFCQGKPWEKNSPQGIFYPYIIVILTPQQSWFTNPDRHCGIWITWLISRTVVDLDCSLQALARCCRQTTCHIDMPEWAQTWLDSARRPCQCLANDNMQVTCHRITQT